MGLAQRFELKPTKLQLSLDWTSVSDDKELGEF
jgi:hypothetical protein